MQFSDHSLAPQGALVQFMYRVYVWMSVAMVISGLVAYVIGSNPALTAKIIGNPFIFFGIIILQFVLVIVLGAKLLKLDYATACVLFVAYAAVTGLMLSTIFLAYTRASIYQTFFVSAGTFSLMALYGYYTKSDLTKMGSFLVMGLFGLIIAMVVNLFWRNTMFDLIVSIIGVLIFIGLTAVDAQKIKYMGQQWLDDRQSLSKIALYGALTLYLDFLNLFLFLLRFMGRQKE